MSSSKRRLKRKGAKPKADELIIKGYMKIGPDNDQGTWRGWRIHADPADDRMPVRIVKGH